MSQSSPEVDPLIAERIAEIRDRFGLGGLRAAIDMAKAEIAAFEGEVAAILDDGAPT